MTVNGIRGANNGMQAGSSGRITQMDSVSKNIQNQIANAQKKLQELSSNEELSIEDKMKKRQEIQQEINNLNQQLRQHQMEQRKEQQTKKTSMDDMLGGSRKTAPKSGNQSAGLSQASMQAMISADSAMKQAKVQGSMAKLLYENGIDIGRQRLFDWLRENGYIFKQSREPMQKWIERGIMTVRECWVTTDHGMELSVTPMITGKGQQHFLNLFCGEK